MRNRYGPYTIIRPGLSAFILKQTSVELQVGDVVLDGEWAWEVTKRLVKSDNNHTFLETIRWYG